VVADLLARPRPLVVAAGGGVATSPDNRAAMAAARAFVVWLRASADFLAPRTDPTHRPLLAGDVRATLGRLLAERSALYEQVADVQIDVEPFHVGDDQPTRALARHIAELIGRAAAVNT
jgi:shikimate kinase